MLQSPPASAVPLKPSLSLPSSMKDRPPHSSYGSVYVPPYQRLRSIIIAPNSLGSSSSSSSSSAAIGSRLSPRSTAINPRKSAIPPPQLDSRYRPPRSNSVGSYWNGSDDDARAGGGNRVAESPPPPPRFVSAYDDGVSEEGSSDRETDWSVFHPPGNTVSSNSEEWKWKLGMLLRDKEKQEVVSREKKDRRDYPQIAALASRMGLHSHMYAKVLVCSKVPLPNYRFDLDDKRPQREVGLPLELLKRVDAYLDEYFQKSRTKGNNPPFFFILAQQCSKRESIRIKVSEI